MKKTDFSAAACLDYNMEAALFRKETALCQAFYSLCYKRIHFLPQQVLPQCVGATSKHVGTLRAHSAFLEMKLSGTTWFIFTVI